MTEAQERYRQDAKKLRQIGHALEGQAPDAVVLPDQLAEAALAAWQRDEQERVESETEEQRRVRGDAATLALIGLQVEEARRSGGTGLVLHPDTFAEARAAATRSG
jgi:hypothetical protein